LEVASTAGSRGRGLLGRDDFAGALLLRPAISVHTIGMRFDIDVAFCDADLVVLEVIRMRRWRLGRPRPKARAVIEAEAGAFERWRLVAGDELEVKGD
jgi:uncharacterized membrane protein (UPF0127 family)